jgi:hypothetical protein
MCGTWEESEKCVVVVTVESKIGTDFKRSIAESPSASDARIRRESGAYVTQMLRTKFANDVRHVARVHHANVARKKGCYFWTPL